MISERDRLLAKARGCHELAETAITPEGRQILDEIAARYEREAAAAVRATHRQGQPLPA